MLRTMKLKEPRCRTKFVSSLPTAWYSVQKTQPSELASPEAMYSERQGLHNLSNFYFLGCDCTLQDRRLAGIIGNGSRRCFGRSVCLRPSFVNQLFQFFARFEIGHPLSRDANWISRFWIPAAPGSALTDTKAAEPSEFNLLSLVQCFNDAFKDNLDQAFRILFR